MTKRRLEVVESNMSMFKEEDYHFLASRIEINDYQFALIFQDGRRTGRTYGLFMKSLLQTKKFGSKRFNPGIIDELTENHNQRLDEIKQFRKFIVDYFSEDFIFTNDIGHSFTLTYIPHRFRMDYPEYCI